MHDRFPSLFSVLDAVWAPGDRRSGRVVTPRTAVDAPMKGNGNRDSLLADIVAGVLLDQVLLAPWRYREAVAGWLHYSAAPDLRVPRQ